MLILSLIAQIFGPLVYFFFRTSKKFLSFVDGFVFTSVLGLLCLHVMSSTGNGSIILICLLMGLGFFGPNFLEKSFSKYKKKIHNNVLIMGLLGLCLHALIDGVALGTHGEAQSAYLSTAIIVHRVPVGLTVWWLLRPKFGIRAASLSLGAMLLATIVGYYFGGDLNLETELFVYIQALVAGSILHVVFYRIHMEDTTAEAKEVEACCHTHVHDKPNHPFFDGLGGLFGIGLLWWFYNSHTSLNALHHHSSSFSLPAFFDSLKHLFLISSPALVLAYALSSVIKLFFNQKVTSWLNKGKTTVQAFKGMIFGLPLPICSCGILPFYQTIVKKGVAPAAALAFLIATPEVGLDAILISLPLLGLEVTIYRLISAILLAFLVALILSRFVKTEPTSILLEETDENLSFKEKFKEALKFGFLDLVDNTGPWIVAGICLAALMEPSLGNINFNLPFGLDILLCSVIGFFVYVCASGATPIVAVMLAKGLSPGAGIAFLLTGPATNLSTIGILSNLHGKKFSLVFTTTVVFISLVLGVIVNLIFTSYGATKLITEHHDELGVFYTVFGYILILIFSYSILRQGPRKFFGHVLNAS